MKRAIFIDGMDKELVLSKVTQLNVEKKMIELTELPDGTWRLIYSKSVIPDISKVKALVIIRED
ncbi:MAG TPA: hypothetical protein VIY48_17055 [Candidatus Paceibacterota bacterium]